MFPKRSERDIVLQFVQVVMALKGSGALADTFDHLSFRSQMRNDKLGVPMEQSSVIQSTDPNWRFDYEGSRIALSKDPRWYRYHEFEEPSPLRDGITVIFTVCVDRIIRETTKVGDQALLKMKFVPRERLIPPLVDNDSTGEVSGDDSWVCVLGGRSSCVGDRIFRRVIFAQGTVFECVAFDVDVSYIRFWR